MAAGEINIPYTAQLVERFRVIRDEIVALSAAADLDQFVQLWLPADLNTQLLRDAVVVARQDATTIEELFEALYAAITQPEIPLEVSEVRVMSLHKSKGLSSPYVFIVGCVEGLMPARPDLALTFARTMDAAAAFKSQITPVSIAGRVARLQASRFIAEMAPHAPAAVYNIPL